MFYRLRLKDGFSLINLAKIRQIEVVGNRLYFRYGSRPPSGSFMFFASGRDVDYYTYDTPEAALRVQEEIASRITPPKGEPLK